MLILRVSVSIKCILVIYFINTVSNKISFFVMCYLKNTFTYIKKIKPPCKGLQSFAASAGLFGPNPMQKIQKGLVNKSSIAF